MSLNRFHDNLMIFQLKIELLNQNLTEMLINVGACFLQILLI